MQFAATTCEGKNTWWLARTTAGAHSDSGLCCLPRQTNRVVYLGSRIGADAVGLTPRFTVVFGPAVADVSASGSRIGPTVGSTLPFPVVAVGAVVAVLPIAGSLMGAAVGLTPRLVVVRLGVSVGETPAVLLAVISTSGLAVGLTGPAGRPRCATLTPVSRPSSIPVRISFFINRTSLSQMSPRRC